MRWYRDNGAARYPSRVSKRRPAESELVDLLESLLASVLFFAFMAFVSRLGVALRQAARISDSLHFRAVNAGTAVASMPAVYQLSRGMASSKLFVGGLAWGADENALKEAFSSYGEVIDIRIITDRDTGRSRGFGFVSFTNDEDAELALQAMDGRNLAGRTICVDYAVQKPGGFGRVGAGLDGGFGGLGGGNIKRD